MAIKSQYLSTILSAPTFSQGIKNAKSKLKGKKFEAIAITGNSGAIFGGALAYSMKKKLILVRKAADTTHSRYGVEGDFSVKSYIFVDDRKVTGNTETRVLKMMDKEIPGAQYTGSYYYNANRFQQRIK